jgi:hypothetical protein
MNLDIDWAPITFQEHLGLGFNNCFKSPYFHVAYILKGKIG